MALPYVQIVVYSNFAKRQLTVAETVARSELRESPRKPVVIWLAPWFTGNRPSPYHMAASTSVNACYTK